MYKYEEVTEINFCTMLCIFLMCFRTLKKPTTINFLCFPYLKKEMCLLF